MCAVECLSVAREKREKNDSLGKELRGGLGLMMKIDKRIINEKQLSTL